MVGLVVTPTTCLSRSSSASVPRTNRSRDRSSNQIETPASLSCFNVWELIMRLSVAGRASFCRPDLGQGRVCRRDHAVGGQPELLVQDLVRRAGAEVVQSQTFPVIADKVAPTHAGRGLDRDTRAHLGGQDLLLV